jgi:hypothetical protein
VHDDELEEDRRLQSGAGRQTTVRSSFGSFQEGNDVTKPFVLKELHVVIGP